MTLGKRIQLARKAKGFTQKQLAEAINAATGTIQQYELDKRQPRMEQFQKIANALEISTAELMKKAVFRIIWKPVINLQLGADK